MAKKKRIKIGAMYREYGEMEGALCRDCCRRKTSLQMQGVWYNERG